MKHTRCLLYHRDCRLQVSFFARSHGELNKPNSKWHFFAEFFLSLFDKQKFRDSDRRVPTVVRTTCQSGRRKPVRLSKKARHFCHFFRDKKWKMTRKLRNMDRERDFISRRNMPVLVALCSASEFVIFGVFLPTESVFFERTNFSALTFLVNSAKYGSVLEVRKIRVLCCPNSKLCVSCLKVMKRNFTLNNISDEKNEQRVTAWMVGQVWPTDE